MHGFQVLKADKVTFLPCWLCCNTIIYLYLCWSHVVSTHTDLQFNLCVFLVVSVRDLHEVRLTEPMPIRSWKHLRKRADDVNQIPPSRPIHQRLPHLWGGSHRLSQYKKILGTLKSFRVLCIHLIIISWFSITCLTTIHLSNICHSSPCLLRFLCTP